MLVLFILEFIAFPTEDNLIILKLILLVYQKFIQKLIMNGLLLYIT